MAEDFGGGNPRGLHFIAELANTVQDDPEASAADLRAVLEHHGGPPFELTEADARELREATAPLIRILSTTEEDRAAEAINSLLDRYPPRPRLVQLPGRPWSLHTRAPRDAGLTHWLLSTAALALALWLSERESCAWGRCAAPGCRRFFIDAGRRTPQRYCGPRCATRVRVAQHRAQRAGAPSGSADEQAPQV
ncbi:CGNR zinc finger domain-containing protein [Kitasatospora sp. NBC_01266]|uniref:CGNR zinc finger domain-containing protein n=1 Tax=Kitasatospora sp. NBC_01266 TaxID=2903572 RepID=UPI002E30F21E|nr:CGNR zinc finger domain-containing protein [Kitasatospora sp. NBC_01266]